MSKSVALRAFYLLVCLALGPSVVGAGSFPARFRNVTAAAGIDFVHHDAPPVPPLFDGQNTRFGVGAAVADFDRHGDHDGDLDLFVTGWSDGSPEGRR